jgi:hypothetical protein
MRFQPWELFGALVSIVLIVVLTGMILRKRFFGAWLISPLAVLLVAFHLLTFLIDYAEFSADSPAWQARLKAARVLSPGANDYVAKEFHDFPSAAFMTKWFMDVASLAWRLGGTEPAVRDLTSGAHYLWHCSQFFALIGVLLLLPRLWSTSPSNRGHGQLAVAALILFSFPLWRASCYDPSVILVLLAGVLVITCSQSMGWPWIPAAGLAVATFFNVYALLLLAPFLMARQWSTVRRFLICMVFLFAPWIVEGNLATWWTATRALWHSTVIEPPLAAGLQGMVRHIMLRAGFGRITPVAVVIIDCILAALVLRRGSLRNRVVGPECRSQADPTLMVSCAEILALVALLAPTPRGSEYALSIPLALLTLRYGWARPGLLVVGLILVILLPGIDIYFLRCHRFFGVLILFVVLPVLGEPTPFTLDMTIPATEKRHPHRQEAPSLG